jgi:transcription initiation factor TFIIB
MNEAKFIDWESHSEIVECPECQDREIILDPERGESICASCGLVLNHHIIDNGREGRRAFSMEEKSKRDQTGSPVSALLPDLGLSTVIDMNSPLSQRMKRIIRWNTRMTWSNRNMLIAATEIKRIGGILNLPTRVKEYAAKIYRKAFRMKLLRGRSIKGMVAATLYYSCRSEKIPRTLQEILKHSDSIPRDVRRCYRTLIRELKLSVPNLDPVILIPKYITALELDNDVEKTAIKIIKVYTRKYPVGGKDPKGLLAAALYVSCLVHKESRSQSRIAKTIGVTEVTLRSRYKEISKLVKF